MNATIPSIIAIVPRETPTPIPAFLPALRPVELGDEVGEVGALGGELDVIVEVACYKYYRTLASVILELKSNSQQM